MTALLDIAGLSVNFPVAGGLFDAFIPGRKRYIDILDGISLSLKSGEEKTLKYSYTVLVAH